MGQKLEEAGYPGHELGGPADGDLPRREARLPAGLVLPRLRGVRPAATRCSASWSCRSARRRRSSAARSTCSTRPTTASRSTRAGTKLCVAGRCPTTRRSSWAATFRHRIAVEGKKPYWVTNSGDGKYCFISFSGDDRVSVVSYAEEKEIASFPVGDHPQRMRMGSMRCEYLGPRSTATRRSCHGSRSCAAGAGAAPGPALGARAAADRGHEAASRHHRPRRSATGTAGLNRLRLGRLRSRGRYRLEVSATDAAGNSSPSKVLRFRIR